MTTKLAFISTTQPGGASDFSLGRALAGSGQRPMSEAQHAIRTKRALEKGGTSFVDAVRANRKAPGVLPSCDDYDRVEALAKNLSNDMELVTRTYKHGRYGIFADAPPNQYGQAKTRFLYDRLCRLVRQWQESGKPTMEICETGFNAGLSSMLMLEAAPAAKVVSFDLGEIRWSRQQAARLALAYPNRFRGVRWGDSNRTLVAYREEEGGKCDVTFIDGVKTYRGRLADYHRLRALAYPGAKFFFDEVTTKACVDGTYRGPEGEPVLGSVHATKRDVTAQWEGTEWDQQCRAIKRDIVPETRASTIAARHGKLRVLECAWPKGVEYDQRDGLCLAEFLDPFT